MFYCSWNLKLKCKVAVTFFLWNSVFGETNPRRTFSFSANTTKLHNSPIYKFWLNIFLARVAITCYYLPFIFQFTSYTFYVLFLYIAILNIFLIQLLIQFICFPDLAEFFQHFLCLVFILRLFGYTPGYLLGNKK